MCTSGKKFENAIKTLTKYFTRINHAYFTNTSSNTHLSSVVGTINQHIELIDLMKFEIGVQSFSNIDRIVWFHVDSRDDINSSITKELATNMQSIVNDEGSMQCKDSAAISIVEDPDETSDELQEAVASLLDLAVANEDGYDQNFTLILVNDNEDSDCNSDDDSFNELKDNE